MSYIDSCLSSGAVPWLADGGPRIARYGSLEEEYARLADGPALIERTDRAVVEVTGSDRVSWLHNLITNDLRNVSPGEGQYAFALNVQGRILFDLVVLVQRESLRLDVHAAWSEQARKHLEKYIITEDVRLADRSASLVRMGLAGQRAKALAQELGAGQASALPLFGWAEVHWRGKPVQLYRHDFFGVFALDLIVPASCAVALWRWLTDDARQAPAVPVGWEAVQVRRIEAGVPFPGSDITDDVLPAETGRLEQAVSFQKGCYLGQEVVERMRSRGQVARRLIGITLAAESSPPPGATVMRDAAKVGMVTSSCHSIALRRPVALSYLKKSAADSGTDVRISWEGGEATGTVTALPFVRA